MLRRYGAQVSLVNPLYDFFWMCVNYDSVVLVRALSVASNTTEDGQLLISVTDSGIGLPVGEPDRIFQAFFTTKPQGTGMGLSISRRIIESHGGRLWASPNDGRGTTFQFTLPVEVTAPSRSAV
jgi:signal transduction histidine kinase